MSSSRRSKKPYPSVDDGDPGISRSRTDVGASTHSTSRTQGGSQQDDEDPGDLFVGWEHRMNTDERRRMRQEEEKHDSTSASKRLSGGSSSRASDSRVGRSTSAYSKYNRSSASKEIRVGGHLHSGSSSSRSGESRRRNDSGESGDTARIERLPPSTRDRPARYDNPESGREQRSTLSRAMDYDAASSASRSRSSKSKKSLGESDFRSPAEQRRQSWAAAQNDPSVPPPRGLSSETISSRKSTDSGSRAAARNRLAERMLADGDVSKSRSRLAEKLGLTEDDSASRYRGSTSRSIASMKSSSASIASIKNSSSRPPIPRDVTEDSTLRTASSASTRSTRNDDPGVVTSSDRARPSGSRRKRHEQHEQSITAEPGRQETVEKSDRASEKTRKSEKARSSRDKARKAEKTKISTQMRIPKDTAPQVDFERAIEDQTEDSEPAAVETDEEEFAEEESEVEEPSSGDDEKQKWSVRVSIISAVDMPNSLVPSTPLCPVLKLGLVAMPTEKEGDDEDETVKGATARRSVLKNIESSGLTSIPKSRVRCTSTKILSKRDHGAVEFHEDMRWDNVKRPQTTALAVELCARAVMPPTNAHESPLPKVEATLEPQVTAPSLGTSYPADAPEIGGKSLPASTSDISRDRTEFSELPSKSVAGDTKSQGLFWGKKSEKKEEEPPSPQEVGGIAGMRALWNKGRQQLEAQRQQGKRKSAAGSAAGKEGELDTANAAAAVARFLIGGPPTGGDTDKDAPEHQGIAENTTGQRSAEEEDEVAPLPDTQFQSRTAITPVGQDVALAIKRRKKRKLEMTEDVRLGAVVVPLTRLPLTKAIEGREAARIETWFPLDTSSNMQVGDGPMRVDRRVPRVLLEISFSSPDILDESEDEMDEPDEEESSFVEDVGPGDPDRTTGIQWDADVVDVKKGIDETNKSFARRASMSAKKEVKSTSVPKAEPPAPPDTDKQEDPTLEPGVIDYICVVGCRDIGDQKLDDGSKGWVNSTPECTTLEAFPPNHEFHESHGRFALLPDKCEWFCFPEGTKLWRGTQPPSHSDLNLKRFSGASPPNVASSIAAFDACLNCTTSFSWFVLSSTSEDYGSKNKKTYGAVIRFYAPAPTGIDPKADDYAQLMMGGPRDATDSRRKSTPGSAKRLWVPMGICIFADLPIIGIMEAILLRICEALAARTGSTMYSSIPDKVFKIVQQDLSNLIVNYQRPIPGVLHCSIPFLQGERLHLTLPPPTGLPPLPHGGSVTSVCRLLSAEGLNILLAAVLTECKILIHSDDVANLAMVAEVITALIYPFDWALPYIPVLPLAMLEIAEAPLSYFLGVPTCSMKHLEPHVLTDVVVIDLDNGFSSQDYLDGRRGNRTTKVPTPLPSSVANNISKAVFRLLREEDDIEVEYGSSAYPASRSLPRLESESLAEREFRISVALQVCSLVRGYQDCLFFVSASQPVFNRDRFLRNAPALFEDRRGNPVFSDSSGSVGSQRLLSPRSKRFLSLLVNTQQFHGLLEVLEHEDVAFFHEVMDTFDSSEDQRDEHVSNLLSGYGSSKLEESASHLSQALQKVEDKIPTYRVDRKGKNKKNDGVFADDDDDDGLEEFLEGDENIHDISFSDDTLISSFTTELLRPIVDGDRNNSDFGDDDDMSLESSQSEGVHSLSVKYLLMLEKNPWRYRKLFDIPLSEDEKPSKRSQSVVVEVREKVKLKDAIGERRYRAWKLLQEQKVLSTEDSQIIPENNGPENDVDFKTMLSSVMTDDMTSETSSVTTTPSLDFSIESSRKAPSVLSPEQQRVADAKDRDALRRCLERAYDGTNRRNSRINRGPAGTSASDADAFVENGRDLIADAETALRNPSAQRFLVSVLSQRSRMENKKKNRFGKEDQKGRHRQANQSSVSRLQHPAFECLVRLCCAMLDACMEAKDYEPAYRLLTQTAGFCTVGDEKQSAVPAREQEENDNNSKLIYMTARIGLHPIFADLRLWEKVLSLHLQNRQNDKSLATTGSSSGRSTPNDGGRSDKAALEGGPSDEYEAAVATLYEMLGYGIPAEELARFATRVSEENGWFSSERGHSLLMLARRLSVRRDVEDGASGAGNLDLMTAGGKSKLEGIQTLGVGIIEESNGKMEWLEIGWSHPAATNMRPSTTMQNESNKTKSRGGASAKYSLLEGVEDDETETSDVGSSSKNGGDDAKYLKRTPITSLASFGSSVVASGGLDGSVFLAHTIRFADEKNKKGSVRGVRLEWGTSGGRLGPATPSMDGEYGVGAVSCLAAAQGPGFRHGNVPDISEQSDEDEVMTAMEGCRVIAGTTGGDLRVWSVKEVYAATALASGQSDSGAIEAVSASLGDLRIQHSGGADSTSISGSRRRNARGSITQIAAGSASSRLKFSLRGWALSGHRGGVSCMDVPSHIYRPDALVTGGADGLIKLWSLVRRTGGDGATPAARLKFHRSSIVGSSGVELSQTRGKGGSGSDALSILTGHGGRVLCVKAAWHGDGLISGGVDRTVRIWDLSGSSGKCVNALSGHLGWVTQAHYWGPHTIVSASTDRAIALWDARARNAPLFVLRHHHAPVSDLLVGSRTDPLMVSAACDGTVATWDFRTLSSDDSNVESIDGKKPSKVIRQPLATMQHRSEGKGLKCSGAVLLSRGTSVPKKSVISVGSDAVVKEWDVATGKSLNKEHTGHCDVISSLTAFTDVQSAALGSSDYGTPTFGGTITSSWDGTVRMRSLVRKKL